MNKEIFRAKLEEEGFPKDSYSLDGDISREAYCLYCSAGTWSTFFLERGLKISEKIFNSESEACLHLIATMKRARSICSF
jgi:hypothetical protein